MRVLVTGAAGFVGSHLCRDLIAHGASVRGLVRSEQGSSLPGVELVSGALTDPHAMRAAVAGVDAVVHLAARVHVMDDRVTNPLAEFRRVNVEGTRTLATAAADARVARFVFASSVKSIGEASRAAWTSATVPVPVDPYGVSKLEAELVLRDLEQFGTSFTVLRFPLVYGPGMKGNMLRLFRLVDRAWPVPVSAEGNARSVLFVGNAAAAITHVLESQMTDSEPRRFGPYFVADGPAPSTATLVKEIAAALKRPARLLHLHESTLRPLARAADLFAPGTLSAILDRLLGSLEVDQREFEAAFGFSPPCSRREGLGATARWFRGLRQ